LTDDGEPDGRGAPAAVPFSESLCHSCGACRYAKGRESTFIMCTALEVKYPRQPVRTCEAFRPRDA
jgi:hypothetical protein